MFCASSGGGYLVEPCFFRDRVSQRFVQKRNIGVNDMDINMMIFSGVVLVAQWVGKPVFTQVGDAVGKRFHDYIITVADSSSSSNDETSQDELVAYAKQLSSSQAYADEQILKDLQLVVKMRLRDPNEFTMVQLHNLYEEYVQVIPLGTMIAIHGLISPQQEISDRIVQSATIKRRLDSLVQQVGPQ
jgi:hypothetical protein